MRECVFMSGWKEKEGKMTASSEKEKDREKEGKKIQNWRNRLFLRKQK